VNAVARATRDISKSMVALVISLSALAVLGLATRLPGWLGQDEGFEDVEPGLLVVEPDARGVATLGGGLTAAMYPSGLRLSRGSDILAESVISGSLVSAVFGSVSGHGDSTREQVDAHVSNMRIRQLLFLPGRATYFGEVFDEERTLPLTIRIELAGPVIRIGFSVVGADGLVIHLDHRPATTGIEPALPPRNLREEAAWIRPAVPSGGPAYTTILGTDIGVGPQDVARGVDVRHLGRVDVHVWSDAAMLTVSSRPRPSP
jgi:hypothetical protein